MIDLESNLALVEDNPFDAELIIRSIRKCQIKTNIAHFSDGLSFLDHISNRQENYPPGKGFHTVLLDLKLPGIDGFELLTHIRSSFCYRTIPVVVLTSSREQRDIEKAYSLGANSYVVKPVELELFYQTIHRITHYWNKVNVSPLNP